MKTFEEWVNQLDEVNRMGGIAGVLGAAGIAAAGVASMFHGGHKTVIKPNDSVPNQNITYDANKAAEFLPSNDVKKTKYQQVFGPKKAEADQLRQKGKILQQNNLKQGTFERGELQQ